MRVTQKEFCVTLKRLSSKDYTLLNPLHPLLGGFRSFQSRSPPLSNQEVPSRIELLYMVLQTIA